MNQNRNATATLALLAPLALLAGAVALAQQGTPASAAAANPSVADLPPWNAPPTPRQIQALVTRAVENQHRNDLALTQFERKERIVSQRGKAAVANEWTTEVIPAGDRRIRVELERDGKTADPGSLEERWRQAAQSLTKDAETDVPNAKQDDERQGRREHARYEARYQERYEMVDAVAQAFRFHWIGRAVQDGRGVLEFSFEPAPSYKSSKLFAIVYAHMVGTVWVDEANSQVVRIDARLRDDISIAAGLIVKIDRGAQASLRQQEVASGIWEPVQYSYDYQGRKLLFGALSGYSRMDASDYRHVGSPDEAIAILRREHPNAIASSH
jgi:hypothetical protein